MFGRFGRYDIVRDEVIQKSRHVSIVEEKAIHRQSGDLIVSQSMKVIRDKYDFSEEFYEELAQNLSPDDVVIIASRKVTKAFR